MADRNMKCNMFICVLCMYYYFTENKRQKNM